MLWLGSTSDTFIIIIVVVIVVVMVVAFYMHVIRGLLIGMLMLTIHIHIHIQLIGWHTCSIIPMRWCCFRHGSVEYVICRRGRRGKTDPSFFRRFNPHQVRTPSTPHQQVIDRHPHQKQTQTNWKTGGDCRKKHQKVSQRS